MRLAVDLDGTLTRTMDLVIRMMNLALGTTYTTKDVAYWDWVRQDKRHEDAFWGAFNVMDATGVRVGLRPYDEHTTSVLARLALRHDVFIVTANDADAEVVIREWLRLHLPYTHRLIDIDCIGRVVSKVKLLRNYDLYIDDSPGLARDIVEFPNKAMLLANARWNSFFDKEQTRPVLDAPQVRRFRSWDQVPALIAQVQKKKGVLSWPAVSPSPV